MGCYLLDTNILIAISKEKPGLAQRLQQYAAKDILIPAVVLAEIEYGIAKSLRQKQNRLVYDAIVRNFQIVRFDAEAARCYGPIRADLEKEGRLIGPYDLLIAAQAVAIGATLVTDNTGEFSRIKVLKLENWLAARG